MTKRVLLSGNEAIARGAYEAGVSVAAGYPGTPATEILESLTRFCEVTCEWSVNEKAALEVCLGASLAGARSLVAMKHVGVNAASDPLFTAAYTGVEGGLVIVTADDPSMHSSQNEQDNRYYALAAKIPMLEPSDAEEARVFTKLAFEMSETYDTPVFVRSTTRLSHSKSVVIIEEREPHTPAGFHRRPEKYVMIPTWARERRLALEKRLQEMTSDADRSTANRVEPGNAETGIVTSGTAYSYVKEVAGDASILKLGLVYPFAEKTVRDFADTVRRLYVVEELGPFLELQIKALGIECIGKEIIPSVGELSPEIVKQGLFREDRATDETFDPSLPERLPRLCPGCPHRTVFKALREKGIIVTGDIGCYTLGTLPPFETIDTCVAMGGSITMAQGIQVALGPDVAKKVASVIGDSTFAHSGITGLLNACWNRRGGLYVVLDNGTTAMTGMQPNPLSGETIYREPAPALDYAHLAKAFGISDDHFLIVDAYDERAVTEGLERLGQQEGVSLLVVQGLCAIEKRRRGKNGTPDAKQKTRSDRRAAADTKNRG